MIYMQKDINKTVSNNQDQQQIPFKSLPKAYFYCIILCISAVYHGYCLTLIPSTSSAQLRKYYGITVPQQVMLSLLNGFYPIGAMIGCLILPFFIGKSNKKRLYYILLLFTFMATGLSAVPSFETLLISRFMLGILTAFYTSISTIFLKQMFQTNIKKPFGAVYSCGRFLGMLLCFMFAQIVEYAEDQIQHIIIFSGPSILALIQVILVYIYLPHSPIDNINFQNQESLCENLAKLYDQQYIPAIAGKYKNHVVASSRMTVTQLGVKLVSRKNILSFHLALLRQFCGITFIVVYARQIMIDFKSPQADNAPLIINSVQFGSGLIGIFMASHFKRKLLVRYSTIVLAIIMLVIGVADLMQNPNFELAVMTLFMVPCASCLLSVIWSYPSQIASGSKGKYTSLLSWTGTAIMITVPPFVINAMPNNSAYPIFFFCTFYLSFSCIVNLIVIEDIVVINQIRSKRMIELANKEPLVS